MWRDIAGYEGLYQISDTGRVLSLQRTIYRCDGVPHRVRQREMKISRQKNGYMNVRLSYQGNETNKCIHRLVATAFIENPNGLPQVNHVDCDKTNNHVGNLEWCTERHNIHHAHQNGLMNPCRGENHWQSKLKEEDVIEIVRLRGVGYTIKQIGDMFGCGDSIITKILHGKAWCHITGLSRRKQTSGKGETNGLAKLSNSQALRIVELKKNGKSTREISNAIGCSLLTVQRVCNGSAWSSVTGIERKSKQK